jgi:hypothetical protein
MTKTSSDDPPAGGNVTVPQSSAVAPAVQLVTLAEISANITGARTIPDILRVVADGARWVLTHSGCTLALITSSGESLSHLSAHK